jgi:hypothetical protein
MRIRAAWLSCLLVIALAANLAAALLPRITAATADPERPAPGDTLRISCRLEDPAGAVSSLTGVLREFPDLSGALQKTSAGAWGFAFPMTAEIQPGTYHLDLVARDAQGLRVPLAPGSATTATFSVGAPQRVTAPPAPEFKPPLVSVRMASVEGRPIEVRHAYRGLANWYKGQLHCHTTNSDGKTAPGALVGKYAADGCAFLMISDHEVVTRDEQSPSGQPLVRILGLERGTREGDMVCIHFLGQAHSLGGQETINTVTHYGGLVMLAHPEHATGYDRRELDGLRGMALVEACNGGVDSTRTWDYLLSKGMIVWGAASDDFHGKAEDATSRDFVVVNADECAPAAIVESLRLGNFYASEGPTLAFALRDGALRISADAPGRFMFRGPYGLRLGQQRADANHSAVYEFRGDEQYVRVEFVRGGDGKRAWSQPFFVAQGK